VPFHALGARFIGYGVAQSMAECWLMAEIARFQADALAQEEARDPERA
jgi:hypothetical protein